MTSEIHSNDRRKSLRFPVALKVHVTLSDETLITVSALNISGEGVQFICDELQARCLAPRGIISAMGQPLTCSIQIDLEENEGARVFCKIVSVRRLSQDDYLFGLEYSSFESSSKVKLDAFIEDRIQMNEEKVSYA